MKTPVTTNNSKIATTFRNFVRTYLAARIAKDDDGLYAMSVKNNSVNLSILNPADVLKALYENCGNPMLQTKSVIVFDFHGMGKISLSSDSGSTLTLINKTTTCKPCTSLQGR